jgi:hypothetical protein
MTISDYITNNIEKAREKSIQFTSEEVQGWIFSPQFLTILQGANIASAICSLLKKKSLPETPYEGRAELYDDISIFLTALVMKVWKLSLGEITRRLKLYPQLAMRLSGGKDNKQVASVSKNKKIRSFTILPLLRIPCISVDSGRCDSSQRLDH